MKTNLLALLLIIPLSVGVFAQTAEEPAEDGATESADDSIDEAAIEEGAVDAEASEDTGDGLFLPSEEIKADSEISFPSDI